MKPARTPFILTLLVSFCLLLVLPGCDEDRDYRNLGNAPQGDGKPVEGAVKEKMQADAETLSRLKANIGAAREANKAQPPGKPTEAVEAELKVADSSLAGVKSSKDEEAASKARTEAIYQGRAEEAKRLYDEANAKALAMAGQRAAAEERLIVAIEAQQKERERFLKEVEELKAYAAKLENAEKSKQVLTLRMIGVGFLIIFGLAVGFGQLAGLRLGWVFALIGFLFLGAAQIVSLWWFKWAVASVIGATIILCAWWIYQRHRENTLAADLQKKTDSLKKLVPILDNAYENISDEQKELRAWLDAKIFGPLSGVMGSKDKAAIHQVRADNAEGS